MSPTAELVLARAGNGRTVVRISRVRAPLAFTRAFDADGAPATAVAWLQSTNGGLHSGDQVSVRIVVEEGASACVAPQAASVVHGAIDGRAARVSTELVVERGGRLVWAPPPTILLPGARLDSATIVQVAESACAIVSEVYTRHEPAGTSPGGVDQDPDDRAGERLSIALEADAAGRAVADRSIITGTWPVPAHGSVWMLAPQPCDISEELLDLDVAAGALPNGCGTGVRLAGPVAEVCRLQHLVVERMQAATTPGPVCLRS